MQDDAAKMPPRRYAYEDDEVRIEMKHVGSRRGRCYAEGWAGVRVPMKCVVGRWAAVVIVVMGRRWQRYPREYLLDAASDWFKSSIQIQMQ